MENLKWEIYTRSSRGRSANTEHIRISISRQAVFSTALCTKMKLTSNKFMQLHKAEDEVNFYIGFSVKIEPRADYKRIMPANQKGIIQAVYIGEILRHLKIDYKKAVGNYDVEYQDEIVYIKIKK